MDKSFLNPLLMMDGYKVDHRRQYPDGTQYVYSNMTPRKSRVDGQEFVVNFGLQYFLKRYLQQLFQEDFFDRPLRVVIDDYRDTMDRYLGKGSVPVEHIADLHGLGYLPLRIKALAEGELCPMKVPLMTIINTHPDFFWLTNQLETVISSSLWCAITSATTAYQYRRAFDAANRETGVDAAFAKFQGHDFSFRGMSSLESAMLSGAGHLTSFAGTDTIPALKFIDQYYGGDNGLVGCSVPATEHSVMCMGGSDGEIDTYRRLIRDIYPSGVVSIVSDTWDFWSIMTAGLVALQDAIIERDGKVVFRPDSGDPVKVVCGDPDAPEGTPERDGAMECLWRVFGGESLGGFRHLSKKVGLIYGDSITLERQAAILSGLKQRGFASDIVLGIGSYTYQMKTRDTFGFAMKATWGVVDGEPRDIFKSPKTDHGGEKKSAKGLLRVYRDEEGFIRLQDQQTVQHEKTGLLTTVFEDGMLQRNVSLSDVRKKLHGDRF